MNPNAIIRFTTRWPYNIGSWLVAHLSGSKEFSHSFVVVGLTAYEASIPHGCRFAPVQRMMDGVRAYQDMPVFLPDLSKAIDWAISVDGHGYDYAGAFGIPFLMSTDWQDDNRWWCSEYVVRFCEKGGLKLLDYEAFERVTPEQIRELDFIKSSIIKV